MKNNYYDMLNESFNKLLLEAQQVVIDFKNIFGANTYEEFKKIKNRLQNPENDISYWVREYNARGDEVISELEAVINGAGNRALDIEGKRIPVPEEEAEVVAENDFYEVYYVEDYVNMIHLAMKKIGGYAGAYWCIAGRYNLGYEARDAGIEKDDAVKVSQAEHFFNRYLEGDYRAYFVCMPKDNSHQKYCICFKDETHCDPWNTEDGIKVEDDIDDVPDFTYGDFTFNSSSYQYEEDEYEDDFENDDEEVLDEPTQWTDENGNVWSSMPPEIRDPEMITIEDPESFEFPARSEADAVAQFAQKGFANAEIVDRLENGMIIVKFTVEPRTETLNNIHGLDENGNDTGEIYTRTLPTERYTPFVFFPGQGGGPLLNQTGGNEFAVVAFINLDNMRNQFGGHFNMGNIHRQGDEPMEAPEGVEESFNYYSDDSWFYEI